MLKLNGEIVNFGRFPVGEKELKISEIKKRASMLDIVLKYESDEDIINLIFLKRTIDDTAYGKSVNLHITYMPYSRMDRTEGTKAFTLKYICELINNLKFNKVFVITPHSDVCVALLDRCTPIDFSENLFYEYHKQLHFNNSCDYVYFPDMSAEKLRGRVINVPNTLVGNKHRDFETGNIDRLDIYGDTSKITKDSKVVMIDDLCSRGTTFIKGAEKLRELGFKRIDLIVTHCEKAIFDGEIFETDLIDKVWTTNSIISKSDLGSEFYGYKNNLSILDIF